MKRLSILILALAALSAAPSGPTLVVTPSPTYVGDSVSFSGCGYQVGKDLTLSIYSPGDVYTGYAITTRVPSTGCIDTSGILSYSPPAAGTYSAYVSPKTGSGVGTYGHHKAIVDYDFEVIV